MPRVTLDTPCYEAALANQWLSVRCVCGHRMALGPNAYGHAEGNPPLRELVPRLRCTVCQAKGRARVVLTYG